MWQSTTGGVPSSVRMAVSGRDLCAQVRKVRPEGRCLERFDESTLVQQGIALVRGEVAAGAPGLAGRGAQRLATGCGEDSRCGRPTCRDLVPRALVAGDRQA